MGLYGGSREGGGFRRLRMGVEVKKESGTTHLLKLALLFQRTASLA